MVKILLAFWCFTLPFSAWAIFSQTAQDIQVLDDQIRQDLSQNQDLAKNFAPVLLATPQHYWVESRPDFGPKIFDMLRKIVKDPNQLIDCAECDSYRVHVKDDQSISINNGPLFLEDFAKLTSNKKYAAAKTVAFATETPSGVEFKLIRISDGKILMAFLADSSKNLNYYNAWTNYAQEVARRKRQESLYYVFINLGFYPKPVVQTEFLEQWGTRNQHISGVGLSLVGPIGAIGFTYHYLWPLWPKFHPSVAAYYKIQSMFSAISGKSDNDSSKGLVGQIMFQYTVGSSFGLFTGFSSDYGVSLGFNFYNPIFMPFLF